MSIDEDPMRDEYLQEIFDKEQEELESHKHEIQEFKRYSSTYGIFIPQESILYAHTIGVVVRQKNILASMLPELKADKEGLFTWDGITKHLSNKNRNGFFYHDKFMVMFHPFFRRGFSEDANYDPGIVKAFIYEGQKRNQALSIALDVNRLRINVDDTFYAEYDTWFGPRFHQDIKIIPDGPAKLAPPLGCDKSLHERWFSNTQFLNILWTSHEGIKEFQLEEVKDESIKVIYQGKMYHPARYIHAEFDLANAIFRHLDGAVHLYTDHEYNIRIQENLNVNVENYRGNIKPLSIKLFKINGQIQTDQFVDYCSLFLTHDPLIHEYFTGELPEYCAKAVKYYQSENKA
jgi:hypothetical protein